MKRLIDVVCPCGHQRIDVWVDGHDYPQCAECETPCATERLWARPKSSGTVIGDDIPGGMLVYNGICHEDGSPRRFYSKTEMKRAAEQKGLRNHVEHMPAQGSDKSKHTTRWV